MKSAVAPCPPSLFPPLDVLHVLHYQRGAHAGQRAEENAAEHQDSHVVRQLRRVEDNHRHHDLPDVVHHAADNADRDRVHPLHARKKAHACQRQHAAGQCVPLIIMARVCSSSTNKTCIFSICLFGNFKCKGTAFSCAAFHGNSSFMLFYHCFYIIKS